MGNAELGNPLWVNITLFKVRFGQVAVFTDVKSINRVHR